MALVSDPIVPMKSLDLKSLDPPPTQKNKALSAREVVANAMSLRREFSGSDDNVGHLASMSKMYNMTSTGSGTSLQAARSNLMNSNSDYKAHQWESQSDIPTMSFPQSDISNLSRCQQSDMSSLSRQQSDMPSLSRLQSDITHVQHANKQMKNTKLSSFF